MIAGFSSRILCSVRIARIFSPHDGYAITYRIGQMVRAADQLLRLLIVFERAFTKRANQDVKQSCVHAISPQCSQLARYQASPRPALPTISDLAKLRLCWWRILLHPFL